MGSLGNGDLNNTAAERARAEIAIDAEYRDVSLAIPVSEDDNATRKQYRPFLLDERHAEQDWISRLELSTALKMVDSQILRNGGARLKILVLYGSMRKRSVLSLPFNLMPLWTVSNLGRSYSKLLSYEASRILFRLGCDVRVFDPSGLPIKDDVQHSHPKVQELRDLSKWSDGHVWISPEQHGNLVRFSDSIFLYAS